ncbi:class E sortase [Actinomadura flavalba]|uniref:class E sortase n=1 Tax=Actinomadura flavalba TaxID=1120938 RepID=UPI00037C1A69|nr:class E sortase [Actinomadura flavalba]
MGKTVLSRFLGAAVAFTVTAPVTLAAPAAESAPAVAPRILAPSPAPTAPLERVTSALALRTAAPARDTPDKKDAPRRPPANGTELGALDITPLRVRGTIREGVGNDILDRGVGHYPGTEMPGELGNTVLLGHRTTGPKPFLNLDRLRPGDLIGVTAKKHRYSYRVRELRVIEPDETDVLAPTPFRKRKGKTGTFLTLITCHPKGEDTRRLVVVATLVPPARG